MVEYNFEAKIYGRKKSPRKLASTFSSPSDRQALLHTGTHTFAWAPEDKLVKPSVHMSGTTPCRVCPGKDLLESVYQNQMQGVSVGSRNMGTAAPVHS